MNELSGIPGVIQVNRRDMLFTTEKAYTEQSRSNAMKMIRLRVKNFGGHRPSWATSFRYRKIQRNKRMKDISIFSPRCSGGFMAIPATTGFFSTCPSDNAKVVEKASIIMRGMRKSNGQRK
jgi:hypothetical protein